MPLSASQWGVFAHEVRGHIGAYLKNEFIQTLVLKAIQVFHKRQLAAHGLLGEQEDMHRSAYSSVTYDIDDFLVDMNTFSMMLFLDPEDTQQEWTYFILYGSRNAKEEFERVFVPKYGCTSFSYWNNTDPEDGVSKAEWDNRWRTWERIGLDSKTPLECGFGVELFTSYSHKWIAGQSINKPERAKQILRELTSAPDFLERRAKARAVDIDAYFEFSQGIERGRETDFVGFLMDYDGKRAQIRADLAERTLKVLTVPSWDDLLAKPA